MRTINEKYYQLLSKEYPTIQSICREIIHLKATLNLPKGTEHYISDLHGEYHAFQHLMNTCSGVIKEKVIFLFQNEMSEKKINDFCQLIYYPEKILQVTHDIQWYRQNILRLIRIARYITSKYTRARVRRHIDADYSEIIDELLHAQLDEMDQQYIYHLRIIDSIIELKEQDYFMEVLIGLIKFFAIDQLHILGDLFDRGGHPDKIIDDLIAYERVDIQWGNHDILWMGAYLGQPACIVTVVKNCLHYQHIHLLERQYGIPLRKLMTFACQKYPRQDEMTAMETYCMDVLIKLESQLIQQYPEWEMNYRIVHPNPEPLTEEEQQFILSLQKSFMNSVQLKKHMDFLFGHGSLYLRTNHNLLLHGCVPLCEDGSLYVYRYFDKPLSGKSYFDYVNQLIHHAYVYHDHIDYFWYLWCGEYSPLCGRRIVLDQPQEEIKNAYYHYIEDEMICINILRAFQLYEKECMIINGHTPVRVKAGESPLKDHKKHVIIDGGFCLQNQKKTGVAGYTLISNSHGMRIKTHHIHNNNFNDDVQYDSQIIYTREYQEMIKDTHRGEMIQEQIRDLEELLKQKKQGTLL